MNDQKLWQNINALQTQIDSLRWRVDVLSAIVGAGVGVVLAIFITFSLYRILG